MNDWRSYNGVAETYERVHAPRTAEAARDLAELAAAPPGGRVLDVGTGTGVAAEAARAAIGPQGLVVGVDVSPAMLAVGRRARPSVPAVAAEAIDLPFRDATFDVVMANFVLSHFTKYETALFDMIRVLKPGGRLALSTWADRLDELQRTWRELVEAAVSRDLLNDALRRAMPWEARFSDKNALEETLRRARLQSVRIEAREYKFRYRLEDYIAGREAAASGRFAREMLGASGWEAFRARARDVFAERFPDPVNDFRDVLLAVASKPS